MYQKESHDRGLFHLPLKNRMAMISTNDTRKNKDTLHLNNSFKNEKRVSKWWPSYQKDLKRQDLLFFHIVNYLEKELFAELTQL